MKIEMYKFLAAFLVLAATPLLANDLQSIYIDSDEYQGMSVSQQKSYIAGMLDGFYFVGRKSNSPEYLSGMLKMCTDHGSVNTIHQELKSIFEETYTEDIALTVSNVIIDKCYDN
tara:strand:+ start:2593 stop:2937 length:345 start_codon:yes stop_codon:yes gene_type:complete